MQFMILFWPEKMSIEQEPDNTYLRHTVLTR